MIEPVDGITQKDGQDAPWFDASTDRYTMCYFDPPEGLERHILTMYDLKAGPIEVHDRHPGALAQLVLVFDGGGEIQLPGHTHIFEPGSYMFCGFDVGSPVVIKGPWHSFGASLSPLGWAALSRAPANKNRNRIMPARDFLGEDIETFASELHARFLAGELTDAELSHSLAKWIETRLHPVAARYERLINRVVEWLSSSLNPDVETLLDTLDFSRRQAERLVSRFFGYSPAALARKFRAIRAAHLLAQPDLTDEGEAEIAAAFCDQSHMIHEIRRFCGYTPSRLGGSEESIFQTMIGLPHLDQLKQFRVIGSLNGHDFHHKR